MTTWKNSGETRANSCRKNDATSTSLRRCRYLWIAPRNQVMSKRRVMSDNPARRIIRISPPSQTATNSSRVIKAGRRVCGDWTRTLSSAALATTMNPPSRKRRDGGQRRSCKPRPVGPIGPCLEPEIFGAPDHLRCANLVCTQPVPDLSGDQPQRRGDAASSRVLRAQDRLVSGCRSRCSLAFSRALLLQACGCASSGG